MESDLTKTSDVRAHDAADAVFDNDTRTPLVVEDADDPVYHADHVDDVAFVARFAQSMMESMPKVMEASKVKILRDVVGEGDDCDESSSELDDDLQEIKKIAESSLKNEKNYLDRIMAEHNLEEISDDENVQDAQGLGLLSFPKLDMELPEIVDTDSDIKLVGTIMSAFDGAICVQGDLTKGVADLGSVLCLKASRAVLGRITDIFGPVSNPIYILEGRAGLNCKNVLKDSDVCVVPQLSTFAVDPNLASPPDYLKAAFTRMEEENSSNDEDDDDDDAHRNRKNTSAKNNYQVTDIDVARHFAGSTSQKNFPQRTNAPQGQPRQQMYGSNFNYSKPRNAGGVAINNHSNSFSAVGVNNSPSHPIDNNSSNDQSEGISFYAPRNTASRVPPHQHNQQYHYNNNNHFNQQHMNSTQTSHPVDNGYYFSSHQQSQLSGANPFADSFQQR